jgi:hypothetical protein
MEGDILKFLYEFYERGDYPHKSLFDILDKLPTKWGDQKSIDDLKERIARLVKGELIERDWSDDYFKSWGQIESGQPFLYRKKFPLSARLTDKGAELVERRLEKQRQKLVDASLLETNQSVKDTNYWVKRASIASAVIAFLTLLYIALDFYKESPKTDISPLQEQIRQSSILLDSIRKHQKGIETSLQTLANDSTKNVLIETKKKTVGTGL